MTPSERRSWETTQARLKAGHAKPPAPKRRGRQVVGDGAKDVQVTIESRLLADADAFAERNGFQRSELIAIGLRMAMTANPAVVKAAAAPEPNTAKSSGGRARRVDAPRSGHTAVATASQPSATHKLSE